MRNWLRRRRIDSHEPLTSRETPAPPSPSPAPSERSGSPLSAFESVCDRIVVLDCETTGVYPTDRVVEVAAVTLDLDGQVVDEWETLVNPCRDVGPSWLHGVTADMVADAPTFDQIAEELATRVHESLVCAHNLPFDARMLTGEYEAVGLDVSLTGVDTLSLARAKLAVACDRFGIVLDAAHRALHDARACAQLLLCVAAHAPVPPVASMVHTPTSPTGQSRRRARPAHSPVIEAHPSKLAAWSARLDHSGAAAALQSYLDVLDRAMSDLHLDDHELSELEALAGALGLSGAQTVTAHRRWLDDLIDAACLDGVVDEIEYDELLRAAHVLDVPADRVEKRTATRRTTTTAVTADAGVGVAFTGVPLDVAGNEIERSHLMDHASRIGMVPEDKFTKSRCGLLVAADPSSQSGKAAKARGWGIPIVSAEEFLAATSGVELTGHVESVGGMEAATCARCGKAFTRIAKGRRQTHCGDCIPDPPDRSRSVSPTPPAMEPVVLATDGIMETLCCQVCDRSFTREVRRGRKPTRCPDCD